MPFYPNNTAADEQVAAKFDLFTKIKKGESIRIRRLPSLLPTGQTLYKQVLHYKLRDPDQPENEKTVAVGCGKHHGPGRKCLLCDVIPILKASGNADLVAMTEYPANIGAQTKYYVPALVAQMGPDRKVAGYSQPTMFTGPDSVGTGLRELDSEYEMNGLDLVYDAEKGQDILIKNPSKPGSYEIKPTGAVGPLPAEAEAAADWDVERILDTKIWDDDKMFRALEFTYPEHNWKAIVADARPKPKEK